MKSLFVKIMLAQVVAVAIALVVVIVITRLGLNRGFASFLEQQESTVLGHLAPAFSEIYSHQGDWTFIRENPESWQRVLRRMRQAAAGQLEGQQPPFRRPQDRRPQRDLAPEIAEERLRRLSALDRLQLRDRLFLLDEDRVHLAGAQHDSDRDVTLESVVVGDRIVGWIGFTAFRGELPADAKRFVRGQVRANLIALIFALVLATVLAFVLARHLSKPVRVLDKTVRDLSRGQFQKRAEIASRDEIGRLAEHVNRLAETLEKNRSARHRWMADIAHELRTPVAILKGEIEALRDGLRAGDDKTYRSLSEEIDHLSVLVNDLQSLALADAGALNLNQEDLDLRDVVQQACDTFGDRLGERDITLDCVASEAVRLSADGQRLRQLLKNLCENCVRYVEQGGRVRITLTRHPAAAEVVVEDSGPGVDASRRGRLFERFYRGEEGRSRAGGGSGLGLAISRNIVEAHGGRIWAEESSLGGLAIHFTLPF